MDKQAFK
jgi:hypothetical protein